MATSDHLSVAAEPNLCSPCSAAHHSAIRCARARGPGEICAMAGSEGTGVHRERSVAKARSRRPLLILTVILECARHPLLEHAKTDSLTEFSTPKPGPGSPKVTPDTAREPVQHRAMFAKMADEQDFSANSV